jgi:hypothetical protein
MQHQAVIPPGLDMSASLTGRADAENSHAKRDRLSPLLRGMLTSAKKCRMSLLLCVLLRLGKMRVTSLLKRELLRNDSDVPATLLSFAQTHVSSTSNGRLWQTASDLPTTLRISGAAAGHTKSSVLATLLIFKSERLADVKCALGPPPYRFRTDVPANSYTFERGVVGCALGLACLGLPWLGSGLAPAWHRLVSGLAPAWLGSGSARLRDRKSNIRNNNKETKINNGKQTMNLATGVANPL